MQCLSMNSCYLLTNVLCREFCLFIRTSAEIEKTDTKENIWSGKAKLIGSHENGSYGLLKMMQKGRTYTVAKKISTLLGSTLQDGERLKLSLLPTNLFSVGLLKMLPVIVI